MSSGVLIRSATIADNASRYAVPAYERLDFRRVGPVQQADGVRYQPMEWVNGA